MLTSAAYLVYLSKIFNSTAKIQEAVYPVNWANSLGGFQNQCDSTLVRSAKEGAILSVSQAAKNKEPISHEVLSNLVDQFGKESNS